MSESPSTGSTPTANASRTSSKAARRPSPGGSETRKLPPWSTILALLIALIAVVLAIVGWFHPSTGPGKFSGQQQQDAKAKICGATGVVRQAVGIGTNMGNPVPDDPSGALAVAANARLALYAGGGFLHQQLAAAPATPGDLSKAVTSYADTLQALGINYLAGAAPSDPVQQPLRDQLVPQLAELDQLCQ